jgi:isoquinoline 1-oxidoreductase beta subunit
MLMTTGQAVYGQDARVDGMLFAVVARAPVHGGKIVKVDDSATMKVPGVVKVMQIEGAPIPGAFQPKAGVAVIAKNTWSAIKGREKLKITWDHGANASFDSAKYESTLKAVVKKPGKVVRENGNLDSALSGAKKRVTADYYVPMLAHVPMEPPAALAIVANGKAELWACTQGPQAGVDNVASRLDIPKENVTVHQTFLGGGFGRKSKPDYLVEAALCSKEMGGKPVKVVWAREDDVQHDYYHAVSAEHLEAGFDGSGKVTGWLHRSAAPTIFSTFMPDPKHEHPLELAMGLQDMPFEISNVRVENPEAAAHARIGWFRSVYNVPHAFAVQSFANELAVAAGKDSKDFLLELLGSDRVINTNKEWNDGWNYGEDPEVYPYETARLRAVIEAAAKGAKWGKSLPKGQALGIAAHHSFTTYTAAVIQVAVKGGVLSIPRVDIAVDCGGQVNPDRVRSQMEGAVIMGVALATQGELTFKNGATQQGNFDTFQVTRMSASPKEIVVHMVNDKAYNKPLGGAGEPGLPPIAPALTNAIFAATGKRIRQFPLKNVDLRAA